VLAYAAEGQSANQHRDRRLPLHVSVLDAEETGRTSRAAVAATTLIASRPSAPENRASVWSYHEPPGPPRRTPPGGCRAGLAITGVDGAVQLR
jgi:hypothetical protein